MKPQDLNLQEWQDLMDRFKKEADKVKSNIVPPAMRIENTQLTIARHFGGCRYNGRSYTYFQPIIPGHEPNPDGTPYVAWLIVRFDFLKWVVSELKKQDKAKKKKAESQQGTLGI